MELAMARKKARRGRRSAAAPLAGPTAPGTQRFSGAFRSRRRQLRHAPIKRPQLAWGRRSASEHCARPISSRPPCLPPPFSTLHCHSEHRTLHTTPRTQRTTHTYSISIGYSTPAARHSSHPLFARIIP
ncbi:unnamed protein product [Pieris brassicae]|uniref:Uncharacterized protein n=1 Tax=Pieris brassicae TaxID=7116 RepID=A0A9P0TCE8_PIEBR|nr:unnamed protein product [Pieris brassicae]